MSKGIARSSGSIQERYLARGIAQEIVLPHSIEMVHLRHGPSPLGIVRQMSVPLVPAPTTTGIVINNVSLVAFDTHLEAIAHVELFGHGHRLVWVSQIIGNEFWWNIKRDPFQLPNPANFIFHGAPAWIRTSFGPENQDDYAVISKSMGIAQYVRRNGKAGKSDPATGMPAWSEPTEIASVSNMQFTALSLLQRTGEGAPLELIGLTLDRRFIYLQGSPATPWDDVRWGEPTSIPSPIEDQFGFPYPIMAASYYQEADRSGIWILANTDRGLRGSTPGLVQIFSDFDPVSNTHHWRHWETIYRTVSGARVAPIDRPDAISVLNTVDSGGFPFRYVVAIAGSEVLMFSYAYEGLGAARNPTWSRPEIIALL